MNFKTFDVADYLKTKAAQAAYLDAAMEEGIEVFYSALGDVARAQGMSKLAAKTGLARENLYKSLSSGGNPEFATVKKVVDGLGLHLKFTPA
jgi:probable addiction module antidote protein